MPMAPRRESSLGRRLRGAVLSLVLGAVPLTGCELLAIEPTADVDNPIDYSGHDLSFQHPGNWKRSEESEVLEGIEMVTISVESPGSTLAVVQQFRPAVPVELESVMVDFTEGMREGLQEEVGGVIDMTEKSTSTVTHAMLGQDREGRRKQYSLSLLGESADHTVDVYAAEFEDRSIIVYLQTADEDRKKSEPGLELVLSTLSVK